MKKQTTVLYILTGIILAAVLFFVFLFPGGDIKTAPVILPETSGDDEKSQLHAAPELIEVGPDSVQTVIRTMSRATGYSRTICAESFWSGGSTRRNIDVWVDGDRCKLEINRDDGGSTLNILLDGDLKTLWYSDHQGSFEAPAAPSEADLYQSLLSYERILELSKGRISEAGYEEYLGEMCIYVRYTEGELGYENVCYVSLASGLVMGEESYSDGTLVIRVTSTQPDLSQPEESVFDSP